MANSLLLVRRFDQKLAQQSAHWRRAFSLFPGLLATRRVNRTVAVMAALGAVLSVLVSCTSTTNNASVSTSASSPAKLSGFQEYQSAQALANDLTKYGHTCVMKPRGHPQRAEDAGECWIGGKEMILSIYPNQSEVYGYLQMIHTISDAGHAPYGWLVGNKWIINCGSRAACEPLQASLGGNIDANMFPATQSTTPTP